jgi:hypothetical protein
MVAIAFKLFGSFCFGAIGLWMWRMGDAWAKNGEIPKEWADADRPSIPTDIGFNASIIWQRVMAIGFYGFAGLLLLSIVFQLIGWIE